MCSGSRHGLHLSSMLSPELQTAIEALLHCTVAELRRIELYELRLVKAEVYAKEHPREGDNGCPPQNCEGN